MRECTHKDDPGLESHHVQCCIACLLSPGGNLHLEGYPCEHLARVVQAIGWIRGWDITTVMLHVPLYWAENVYLGDPRARMENRKGKPTLVIPMQIGDLTAVVDRRDDTVVVARNGDTLFIARYA